MFSIFNLIIKHIIECFKTINYIEESQIPISSALSPEPTPGTPTTNTKTRGTSFTPITPGIFPIGQSQPLILENNSSNSPPSPYFTATQNGKSSSTSTLVAIIKNICNKKTVRM